MEIIHPAICFCLTALSVLFSDEILAGDAVPVHRTAVNRLAPISCPQERIEEKQSAVAAAQFKIAA
jgi:hypothetical protein